VQRDKFPKKLEKKLAKKDQGVLVKSEMMNTKHGEEKKWIQNDTASDKHQLMKKIHRAGVAVLKSQIRDFKAVKMCLARTEINHMKTQNDQKGNIDKLNNDIRSIKHKKAKLSGLITALTNGKENALKKLDKSVTLKLKGQ
jgi:hypothetical protein